MELKPGYKLTEVGVVPEDWRIQPLAKFAELVSSKRIFESDYVSTGIPFYRGGEISLLIENKSLSEEFFISEARYEAIVRRFGAPVKGDILITAVGTLGNIYLIPDNSKFYFKDGNLIWLRAVHGIDHKYLTIQLRNRKKDILDNAIGSTQKALTIITLKETSIPLPPTLAEQRAITEALSDADALNESLEQLIAKKRAVKQGAMQELLTGKRRLPGFSGEWEVKRLGDIAEIAMGRTPARLNPAYWGGGYKWLSIADLRTKVVTESREEITALAAAEMQVIPKGTLLMSFKLSIGRLCFAGCDLYTNEAICSFKDLKANADFLYYILSRTDFSLYGKQAVKGYTLNKVSLNLVAICLPSLPEQTAIAAVLSDMDTEIAALETKLAKARQVKQGMMQELLTGKTRLI